MINPEWKKAAARIKKAQAEAQELADERKARLMRSVEELRELLSGESAKVVKTLFASEGDWYFFLFATQIEKGVWLVRMLHAPTMGLYSIDAGRELYDVLASWRAVGPSHEKGQTLCASHYADSTPTTLPVITEAFILRNPMIDGGEGDMIDAALTRIRAELDRIAAKINSSDHLNP